MSNDKLLDLEREHDNAKTNAKIGICIAGAGVLLLFAKLIWGTDVSNTLSGIIIGGGLVFCGVCYDKYGKVRRKMDEMCYLKYGKSHQQAYMDIRDDRDNANNK